MENKASVTETSVDEESVVNTIPSEPKRKIEWKEIASALTILSPLIYGIASGLDYLYLLFWDIPFEFLHKESNYYVFLFVAVVCFAAVLGFISSVINLMQTRVLHSKHKIGKSILLFILVLLFSFVLIVISAAAILYAGSDNAPLIKILFYLFYDHKTLFTLIFLSVYFTVLFYLIGFSVIPLTNKEKKEKPNESSKNRIILSGFVLLTSILIAVGVFAYMLVNTYKNTTTFDIIDNQYVVLYKDMDTFVVKECCIHRDGENDKIYINTDAYRLIDAKDIEVQTIHLSSEDKQVFDLCTAEEYAEHLASESPAHETSG